MSQRTQKQNVASYRGDSPDVFVCYAHSDSDFVQGQIRWLNDLGFKIWYDEGISPGSEWSDGIATAISTCGVFLYFASASSQSSRHCLNEIHFAVGLDKAVLAVSQKAFQLSPQLELMLASRQRIDRSELGEKAYEEELPRAIRNLATGGEARMDPMPEISKHAIVRWAEKLLGKAAEAKREKREPPSIAILPFSSDNQDGATIATVVAEDLKMLLSSNPGIRHVPLTLNKRTKEDPIAIGRKRGVDYVIDGQIRLLGEQVQIRVHLYASESEEEMWVKNFSTTTETLMNTQGEIIGSIARTVGPAVWYSEGLRLRRQQPANLEVWELVHLVDVIEWDTEDDEALILARRAVALDPKFGPALATLARVLANRVANFESTNGREDFKEAVELVDRALVIAPNDPRVLESASVVKMTGGELDIALRLARRSGEMDPTGPFAFLGPALIAFGEVESGMACLRRDIERISTNSRLAIAYACLATGHRVKGEFTEAQELLKEAIALRPHKAGIAMFNLAVCLVQGDKETEAVEIMAKARAALPRASERAVMRLITATAPPDSHEQLRGVVQELWIQSDAVAELHPG